MGLAPSQSHPCSGGVTHIPVIYPQPTHLDRILLVGDEVDASLHAGMRALPQHILSQLVHIWEVAGGP